MTKVVITTVPFVDEDSPLAAPAVLKAALESNGIPCVGLDLNIEIYNKIKDHPFRDRFLKFFYRQKLDDAVVPVVVDMLDHYVNELLIHQPTHIGLSLFSNNSQVFTAWLCAALRQVAPDVTILIGGPGLETLSNSLFKFPERLKQLGLIDDFIVGDAEQAIVDYFTGDTSSANIIDFQRVADLNKIPLPDYSDYRFFHYSNLILPIIDSRGCVQRCEFCDVIEQWTKFQYTTAEHVFSEMKQYINMYNIYQFQFSSSICNGNKKEFAKLVSMIAEYNRSCDYIEQQIHWVGSFIVRRADRHPESLWKLISESNGFLLTGVESIIPHVRIELGKNFNNEDLEVHLNMCAKYNVPTNLLMIAAYPSETVDDYNASKQWFQDHVNYAGNPIKQVQMTLPTILPGTQLERRIDHKEFEQSENQRNKHAHELAEVARECGFEVRQFFV